jgi:hypothetical protein
MISQQLKNIAIIAISFIIGGSWSCQHSISDTNKEAYNQNPVITRVYISKYAGSQDSVFRGDQGIEFTCDAYDKDGFIADYVWEATGGTIQGAANHARWDAPLPVPGLYYIVVTVKDNGNNIARETFEVDVLNRPPVINVFTVFQTQPNHQPYFNVGNRGTFIVGAGDPEHDGLNYRFLFPDTSTDWRGSNSINWIAPPGLPYVNLVYCEVRDEFGGVGIDSMEIYVSN